MTARCSDRSPDPTDRETAAELVAIAIDPAIPYTRAIDAIAEKLAQMRGAELEARP